MNRLEISAESPVEKERKEKEIEKIPVKIPSNNEIVESEKSEVEKQEISDNSDSDCRKKSLEPETYDQIPVGTVFAEEARRKSENSEKSEEIETENSENMTGLIKPVIKYEAESISLTDIKLDGDLAENTEKKSEIVENGSLSVTTNDIARVDS